MIKTSRYSYGPNLTYRCFGEPSSGSASVASTSSTSPWSTSTCPTRSWRSPETSPYVWSRGSEDLSRSSSSLTTPGNYSYLFLASSVHYGQQSAVLIRSVHITVCGVFSATLFKNGLRPSFSCHVTEILYKCTSISDKPACKISA